MGFWHAYMGIVGGSPAAAPPVPAGIAVVTFVAAKPTITFEGVELVAGVVTFTGAEIVGGVSRLPNFADEKGTYEIRASFQDEDGDPLTPDTLTWSLYTLGGTVVNSRLNEVISPLSTVSIVLQDDDLAVLALTDNRRRRVTINGTFTSDLGSGLPLTGECEFKIADFIGVN